MDSQKLDGGVALVTGGASGIGEACAKEFAAHGSKVVVADLNEDHGGRVVQTIRDEGGECHFVRADVGDPKDVERMVVEAVKTYGRLDFAVNNAGIGGELKPTGEYDIDAWEKVIRINLNGVFYCMRYEIPQMVKQGGGAIVNMASILGSVGFANAPAYVAAKHGVVGLTKSAAMEHAAQGVRINSVGPAFIKTPLLDALDAEAQEQITALHPIGRMGTSEEVASLVVFLCSEEASFLTGAYYLADGGYTAR